MVTVIKKGTPKEDVRKQVEEVIKKTTKSSILQYAGKLKTDIDPLVFQRKLRDEWG